MTRYVAGCALVGGFLYSMLPYDMGHANAGGTPSTPREKGASALTMRFTPNHKLKSVEDDARVFLESKEK